MTTVTWKEPVYEALARLLEARTGLIFIPSRLTDLESGTRRAMARSRISDLGEFLRLLEGDRIPLDDLIAEITVGETYFFRDPAQFDFIRRDVLPEINRLRGLSHTLRAWSAGCSSGEEAYSLAILLEEEGMAEGARIMATDLSRVALAKAREGAYGSWSFRAAGQAFTDRYFHPAGERWAIDDRFHRRVRFEYHNLALDTYPSLGSGIWGMDLVLCRNVLIYFDHETVRKVSRRLLESLADGGWLITGPSDPPLGDWVPCETVVTAAGVFYRRGVNGEGTHPKTNPGPRTILEGLRDPEPPAAVPDKQSAYPHPAQAADPMPRSDSSFGTTSLRNAREALSNGDYALVVDLTRPFATDPLACELQVRALANMNGPGTAIHAASEAVSHHPLSPALHFLEAALLIHLGNDDQAMQALRRVIYLDRTLAFAHMILASLLRRKGDKTGARRSYRNALRLCETCPGSTTVPLSDGERAARLAEVAKVELSLLEGGL